MSICLVVLGHLSGTRGFVTLPRALEDRISLFGVRIFFVISGFLITHLLLAEETRTGSISLKRFYVRRALRIVPASYAYVACIALAGWWGWVQLRDGDVLSALTFTTNYHRDRSWVLGHLWSLSVEEQFYVVWPFVMRYGRSGAASRVAVAMVLAAPLLRVMILLWAGVPGSRLGVGETFPTVADSLATGCLLACYRDRIAAVAPVLNVVRSRAFWIVPTVMCLAALVPSTILSVLVGETVCNLGIACVIERVIRVPNDLPGRVLNAPVMVYGGALSYSLYLWQQPFLNRYSIAVISAFPVNLALAVVSAMLSYHLLERPLLRLRGRIEASAWPAWAWCRPSGEALGPMVK